MAPRRMRGPNDRRSTTSARSNAGSTAPGDALVLAGTGTGSSTAPHSTSHPSALSESSAGNDHITNIVLTSNVMGEDGRGFRICERPGVDLLFPSGRGGQISSRYELSEITGSMEDRDRSIQDKVWEEVALSRPNELWTEDDLEELASSLQKEMPTVRFTIDRSSVMKGEDHPESAYHRQGKGDGYMPFTPEYGREVSVIFSDRTALKSVRHDHLRHVMLTCECCPGADLPGAEPVPY